MICINCRHSQDIGAFCMKCGKKFGEQEASIAINTEHVNASEAVHEPLPPTEIVEPNIHVEKIKAHSKKYGSYIVQQLKRPSQTPNDDKASFSNGLISIILLGVLIALSMYTAKRSYLFEYESGLQSIFTSIIIFVLVSIGIALLSLFTISHFFGPPLSFKSIVSVYGAHLSPLLTGVILSILLMLLKSYTYGHFVLNIIFLFAAFILPLYLITSLLTKKPVEVDPLYGFMLYIVTFGILFMIFITIMADSTMGGYFDEFWSW